MSGAKVTCSVPESLAGYDCESARGLPRAEAGLQPAPGKVDTGGSGRLEI